MARRAPRRRLYDHEAARDAVEIRVELIRFLLDPRRPHSSNRVKELGPRIQRFYHDLLGACPYLNKIVKQDNPRTPTVATMTITAAIPRSNTPDHNAEPLDFSLLCGFCVSV